MGGLHFQYMVDLLGVAYPVLRLKADYLDGIRFDHATLQHIFFNSPFHLNSK
jgi:acyl-CoA thioesterase FadM